MPLDAEKRREYQRQYRARKQDAPEPVVELPQELETRTMRERVERTWTNPFDDGLPDTGELISRMPQSKRDEILNHPAIRTSRS